GLLLFPKEITRVQNAASESDVSYDVTFENALHTPSPWDSLQPNPPAILNADLFDGGSLLSMKWVDTLYPVEHVNATSTHAERVSIRIVPAYSVMTEPRQTIQKLGESHEAFDVYLKVHSYATKAGTVSVALDVPNGWTASAPQEVAFDGVGDRYV